MIFRSQHAGRKVRVWAGEHTVHILVDGELVKAAASALDAGNLHELSMRGAVLAGPPPAAPATARLGRLQPGAAGAISVERLVPADGVIMVARQRLRVGRTYAGELITVHVEDTYFCITLNGADLALHPRKERRSVTRFRVKIHTPKL